MTELQTERKGLLLITSFPGLNLTDKEEMSRKFQLRTGVADSGAVSPLGQCCPTLEPQFRAIFLPVVASANVETESAYKSGVTDVDPLGERGKERAAIEHLVALEEHATHADFRKDSLVLE